VVMEAYLHGVSTREVDDLVKAPTAAHGTRPPRLVRLRGCGPSP
jgi:transposase-like protein